MQQIKSIINFADYMFGLIWGYSLIEFLPFLSSLGVFSNVDQRLKTCVLILGLFYGAARLVFFCMKGVRENARALLEERKMEQEIEIQKVELYQKFNNEFLKNNK